MRVEARQNGNSKYWSFVWPVLIAGVTAGCSLAVTYFPECDHECSGEDHATVQESAE